MKVIKTNRNYEIKVDDDVYEWASKNKWFVTKLGYAIRSYGGRKNRKTIYLHRMIINIPSGYVTDHINGNRLDNRRENLRVATRSQNRINSNIQKNNKSGTRGVYYDKHKKRWIVRLYKMRKKMLLASFKNIDEARKAYHNKAIEVYGEFYLNKIKYL